MSTAAQVGNLLNTQADLNFYTAQLNYWSGKYESNSEKLEKQVKYEEKWEKAFDDAIDNDKELKVSCNGKSIVVKENNTNEKLADMYAHAKVQKYDEELSLELAELDIEYDTMKTMYEALVTLKQAEKEREKQSAATSAQDTHLLQS